MLTPFLLVWSHLFATLFMLGLIWFVQIVHYPLFAGVSSHSFVSYAVEHGKLTTFVVMPVMLLELATAIMLFTASPPGISPKLVLLGLILVVVIWLSTFFLQVPAHEKLSSGFDETAHRFLVLSNWVRTLAWSVRGYIAITIVDSFYRSSI